MPPETTKRQLENELRAARQLCGFQLEKIKRLKATIAKLERRLKAAQNVIVD